MSNILKKRKSSFSQYKPIQLPSQIKDFTSNIDEIKEEYPSPLFHKQNSPLAFDEIIETNADPIGMIIFSLFSFSIEFKFKF